ncbi:hypothetical protein C437_04895 [Haloarcula vallismortis ATCC 29715]|uniref:Uncharacterized protein n=1 Tax=Haloarcula vallismortis ATCC 29715 TaxID=662477 RepID=M0JLT4_HALVA|nr:hypothetical protein C437_04895 [Haloarcula vallismortis ATCC 29715]
MVCTYGLLLSDPEVQQIIEEDQLLSFLVGGLDWLIVGLGVILVFCWGFVAYLGLEYLKSKGGTE